MLVSLYRSHEQRGVALRALSIASTFNGDLEQAASCHDPIVRIMPNDYFAPNASPEGRALIRRYSAKDWHA
jgi:hypothetical protein